MGGGGERKRRRLREAVVDVYLCRAWKKPHFRCMHIQTVDASPPSFSPSFSFSRHSLPPLFQFPALLFPLFFPLFLPFSPFSARRLAPSLSEESWSEVLLCIKLARFPFRNTSQASRVEAAHERPQWPSVQGRKHCIEGFPHEAKESGRSQSGGAQTPHQGRRHEQAVPLLPGSPVYTAAARKKCSSKNERDWLCCVVWLWNDSRVATK